MRKLICFAILAVFFNSCEINDYSNVEIYTQSFSVNERHWLDGNDDSGHYYYCEFQVPDLTYEIFNRGMMNAYLSYRLDGVDILSPLPYDDFWLTNPGTPYEQKWTEQVSCEFSPGYVTFILKYDDHTLNRPHYENYDFIVRFMR
jgi:hypothetical protein